MSRKLTYVFLLLAFQLTSQNLPILPNHIPENIKSTLTRANRPEASMTPQKASSYLAKMTGHKYYSRTQGGQFQPASAGEYIYDLNGNHIKTNVFIWDGTNMTLANVDTLSLNTAGQMVYREFFSFQGGTRTPVQRFNTTYNQNNMVESELLENWNGSTYDTGQLSMHYYSGSRIDSTKIYGMVSGNVALSGIYHFTYNGSGQKGTDHFYTVSNGFRSLGLIQEFEYSAQGFLAAIYSRSNVYNANFDTTSIERHWQNSNGHDTLILTENVDSTLTLMPNLRQTITYDQNQNEAVLTSSWFINNQWTDWYKSAVYPDLTIDIQDVQATYQFENGFINLNNKVDHISYLLDFLGTYLDDSVSYTYDIFIGLDEEPERVIRVGPNPFTEHLNISINQPTQVELYDITGRIIRVEKGVTNQIRWDVSELRPGNYVLRLIQGKHEKSIKLVKQ